MELIEMRVPGARAPWSLRASLLGISLALLLHFVGSQAAGWLIWEWGWQRQPQLALPLALVQLLMLLPPLLIMARHGNLVQLLGLDRFDWLMPIELVVALGLGYCGILSWGLFLYFYDLQAQPPILPLFGEGTAAFVSVLLVGVILAPLVEEIVFRGFLFAGLRERIGPGAAAMASGLLFGAIHLQLYAFPVLSLLGVLLALLYHRTGTLWMPILMHFSINFISITLQYLAVMQGL